MSLTRYRRAERDLRRPGATIPAAKRAGGVVERDIPIMLGEPREQGIDVMLAAPAAPVAADFCPVFAQQIGERLMRWDGRPTHAGIRTKRAQTSRARFLIAAYRKTKSLLQCRDPAAPALQLGKLALGELHRPCWLVRPRACQNGRCKSHSIRRDMAKRSVATGQQDDLHTGSRVHQDIGHRVQTAATVMV